MNELHCEAWILNMIYLKMQITPTQTQSYCNKLHHHNLGTNLLVQPEIPFPTP